MRTKAVNQRSQPTDDMARRRRESAKKAAATRKARREAEFITIDDPLADMRLEAAAGWFNLLNAIADNVESGDTKAERLRHADYIREPASWWRQLHISY